MNYQHRNRDYWSRPYQSDRSRWDYGNTRIVADEHPRTPLRIVCLVVAMVAVGFVVMGGV